MSENKCGTCKDFASCFDISNQIMRLKEITEEDLNQAGNIPACDNYKEKEIEGNKGN